MIFLYGLSTIPSSSNAVAYVHYYHSFVHVEYRSITVYCTCKCIHVPHLILLCSFDTCETRRDYFYMCPVCDGKCDFWYLGDTCNFAHVSFTMESERGVVKLHIPMHTQLYMYLYLCIYVQYSSVLLLKLRSSKNASSCSHIPLE